ERGRSGRPLRARRGRQRDRASSGAGLEPGPERPVLHPLTWLHHHRRTHPGAGRHQPGRAAGDRPAAPRRDVCVDLDVRAGACLAPHPAQQRGSARGAGAQHRRRRRAPEHQLVVDGRQAVVPGQVHPERSQGVTSLFTPALSRVWEALSVLRGEVSTKPSQTQGRITSVNPVRVQLDTDSSPSPLTPRVLNGPVAVGDRVTVLHTKHDLTVVGIVGKKPVAGHRYAVQGQTIPANTVTTLGIFGSAGDTVSGGVTTVGNYGLRVPEDGWYSLSGMLRWEGSSPSTQLRIMDFTRGDILANDYTYPADA